MTWRAKVSQRRQVRCGCCTCRDVVVLAQVERRSETRHAAAGDDDVERLDCGAVHCGLGHLADG